jgi:tetratricopeptide (TPR) repeat protein
MVGTELEPSVWHDLEEHDQHPIYGVFDLQTAGVGLPGAERFAEILERRAEDGDPNAAKIAGVFALNRGQPGRATPLLRIGETLDWCFRLGCQQPEMWIQAGLYWDADPAEVRRVRDSLEVATRTISIENIAEGDFDEWLKLHQRCWMAISDLYRDATADVAETIALARQAEALADSLRVARRPARCAAFIMALVAVQAGDPNAGSAVAAADSAFNLGVWSRYQVAWSILLADLYYGLGEPEQGLDIMRRVWMDLGEEYIQFLSPRLLRRARWAVELGYRDEAIQSYQHYLRLMSDPEPVLADRVEAVRAELAELLGE